VPLQPIARQRQRFVKASDLGIRPAQRTDSRPKGRGPQAIPPRRWRLHPLMADQPLSKSVSRTPRGAGLDQPVGAAGSPRAGLDGPGGRICSGRWSCPAGWWRRRPNVVTAPGLWPTTRGPRSPATSHGLEAEVLEGRADCESSRAMGAYLGACPGLRVAAEVSSILTYRPLERGPAAGWC